MCAADAPRLSRDAIPARLPSNNRGGYKTGQFKIRELRTKAEQQLGSKFDVRQFHDVVLGQGAVPLDLLEAQVNAWAGKMLQ